MKTTETKDDDDLEQNESTGLKGQHRVDPSNCSGAADALVTELQNLAATGYPLCQEARLLLQMAVDAQLGKPMDIARLLPSEPLLSPAQCWPAKFLANWPNQGLVPCCERHARALKALGGHLGFSVPLSRAPIGSECVNCKNEQANA